MSAAEAPLAFHTVKHHNSRSMDSSSVLLKKIIKAFPDSYTPQRFSSTKTEVTANGVIAPHLEEVIREANEISTVAFLQTAEKIFPIIIRYFDWKNGDVQTKLVEVK